MRIVDLILGVVWIVFWVGWIAAGIATGGRGRATPWNRGLIVRAGIAVVVVVLARTRVITGVSATFDATTVAAGLALFALGIGLAIWSRVMLGRNWGMPMSELRGARLVTGGPYHLVRHPIYTGIIVAMLGTAIVIGPVWLIVAALLGGYFVYSAFVEDGINARRFTTAYAAYRARTKLLIPFVL